MARTWPTAGGTHKISLGNITLKPGMDVISYGCRWNGTPLDENDTRLFALADGTAANKHLLMIGQQDSGGSENQARTRIEIGGAVVTLAAAAGTFPLAAGWHSFVVVYDGLNVRIFIDDPDTVVSGGAVGATGTVGGMTKPGFIGNSHAAGTAALKGAIADVFVDRSIWSQDKRRAYMRGDQDFRELLVLPELAMPLDTYGPVERDHSGLGRHGTVDSGIMEANPLRVYVKTEPALLAATQGTGAASYSIAGAVTVTPSIAAGLAPNRHAALAGAIPVTPSVAAALDYTLNVALSGAVSVTPTAAAGTAFQGGNTIIGDVTLVVLLGAAMTFSRHSAIMGAVAVTPDVAAGLGLTIHRILVGNIALGVAPTALDLVHANAGSIVERTNLADEVRLSEIAGSSGPINLSGKVA